jgi:pimeloyl-ACP methyl ester carboxylesterase
MSSATINGIELYYELSGQAGEPLVLVHGSWGEHHGWDLMVPALARSFRVLTYDRRGHSRSERPAGQGSVREDVSDLSALIEHLGLAPAHFLGNSFGGSIVLRLTAERPDLFRSLNVHEPALFSLLDPAADREILQSVQERIRAVMELLEKGEMEAGARQFVETLTLGPGAWERLPERLRQSMCVNAPTFLDEQRDPEWLAIDLQRLARFSPPALLTRGDQSSPIFPLVIEKLAGTLAHAQAQTLQGVGHVPQLSHPQEYVEAVVSFIRATGSVNPAGSAK